MGIASPVLSLGHLIDLVASAQDDPQKILEKSFDWEHARAVEFAKWLLTMSSSVFVAIAAIMFSRQFQSTAVEIQQIEIPVINLVAVIATILGLLGVWALVSAKMLQKRYIETSALLAKILETKEFWIKLRKSGAI